MIPYGRHFLDEQDIQSVVEVLKNGWLTQGPEIKKFEVEFAKMVGAKFAVAVSSGTAALHLSCLVLDLPAGTKGITSANTFVASANAMIYCGLSPDFSDIDADHLNMDLSSYDFERGEVPGLLMPVHFAGAPVPMEEIYKYAAKYDCHIIEDASHALGATYKNGQAVGSCCYSDLTTFSLHPVKGVTSGEGGIITTNDEILYNRLLRLRSHGIEKGNFDFPNISHGDSSLQLENYAFTDGVLNPWYYEMQSLGFNYRITDFQAALAHSQLKKFGKFVGRRRELSHLYDQLLKNIDYIEPKQLKLRDFSSLHIYVVEIEWAKLGRNRNAVMRQLYDKGIGTQVHYIPVPLHPYFKNLGFNISDYPNALNYYNKGLTLPLYYGLKDCEVNFVIETIMETLYHQ